MEGIWGPRAVEARRTSAGNSPEVETGRCHLQLWLPGGVPIRLAETTGTQVERIRKEIEGYAALRATTLVEGGAMLPLEERLRYWATILQRQQILVSAAPIAPLRLVRIAA